MPAMLASAWLPRRVTTATEHAARLANSADETVEFFTGRDTGVVTLHQALAQAAAQLLDPGLELVLLEQGPEPVLVYGPGYEVADGDGQLDIPANGRETLRDGNVSRDARRFSPTLPRTSPARSMTSSRLPKLASHLAAVFGPTLGTPGMLSTLSPMSAR